MTLFLIGLLALPAFLLLASLAGTRFSRNADLKADPVTGSQASPTLFVLVHGMSPTTQRWNALQRALEPHGRVLRLHYNAAPWSNADPAAVAAGIGREVQEAVQQTQARRVVMVAHSMGGLITRRALLDGRGQDWVGRVGRVVLMAGVNRGWTLAGDAPADGDPLYRFGMRVAYWGARMLGMGDLVFALERGSPFVANLRLAWMNWMRADAGPPFEVVQMLGDIDDIVSREDNEDLRTMATKSFAQLQLRGTGHGDIVDFGVDAKAGSEEEELGAYRRAKFITAATAPFEQVQLLDEVQPHGTDDNITEVVFVLHGIRDLGRWAANFETAIDRLYPGRRANLAVVSSRYGYFGMGPFLFEDVRNRYVRWFMDQYTETLARYPKLKRENIRFFGHSNGTYIVAEALQAYDEMRIERVVFAGSVVPKAYPWAKLGDRVKRVRNYVGTQDWVVALFPRLFELPGPSLLGNSIGSAGFNGFDDEARVDNVRYVHGEHGAFESRVDEIVGFLLAPGEPQPALREERGVAGHVMASPLSVVLTWALLAFVVLWLGARVVGAASSPAWPVLLAYVLLVTAILRTV